MAQERTQRRLAAILVADVVGYSRLMEADEIGTLAALTSRRKEVLKPLVAKHQGRVFKVTGDGALVEFVRTGKEKSHRASSVAAPSWCSAARLEKDRIVIGKWTPKRSAITSEGSIEAVPKRLHLHVVAEDPLSGVVVVFGCRQERQ